MKCSLGQCDDSDESINAEFAKAICWVCVGAYTIVADATKEALDTVHKDGVAVGYQLAINLNVPTVEGCMKFYFNDDPKRVATAVQTLCKGKS